MSQFGTNNGAQLKVFQANQPARFTTFSVHIFYTADRKLNFTQTFDIGHKKGFS